MRDVEGEGCDVMCCAVMCFFVVVKRVENYIGLGFGRSR